jgi:hypothetical protein
MSTRGSVLVWLDVHTRSVKEYAAETGGSGPQAQEAFSESEPPFARHGHQKIARLRVLSKRSTQAQTGTLEYGSP